MFLSEAQVHRDLNLRPDAMGRLEEEIFVPHKARVLNPNEFDVVYTGNDWTERCFKGKYKVKRVDMVENVSSTIIRNWILKNKNWESLVPKEVVEFISKIKGVERVKKIR